MAKALHTVAWIMMCAGVISLPRSYEHRRGTPDSVNDKLFRLVANYWPTIVVILGLCIELFILWCPSFFANQH